ncbi:antitoxin VbhA family protein, partial [Escherichia coli]|uniref:antitoxin VbhA family protein n=1 Tax=Escherichia coli TaxID=562 RepID=UPI001BFCB154
PAGPLKHVQSGQLYLKKLCPVCGGMVWPLAAPPPPPLYEGIKQRIIAGEITYEQGRAEIFEYHAQRAKQHQA